MKMLRGGCVLAVSCLLLALAGIRLPAAHAAAAMQAEVGYEVPLTTQLAQPGGLTAESNVYMLPPRTQEVPGLAGVKRLFLGALLMAAAIFHFSQFTYKEVMPVRERVLQNVVEVGARLIGEKAPNKMKVIAKRYADYAEEHPVIAMGELGGAVIGLALVLSGIVALGRPRKMKQKVVANGFL